MVPWRSYPPVSRELTFLKGLFIEGFFFFFSIFTDSIFLGGKILKSPDFISNFIKHLFVTERRGGGSSCLPLKSQ